MRLCHAILLGLLVSGCVYAQEEEVQEAEDAMETATEMTVEEKHASEHTWQENPVSAEEKKPRAENALEDAAEMRKAESVGTMQIGKGLTKHTVGIFNPTKFKIIIWLGIHDRFQPFELEEGIMWYSHKYEDGPIVKIHTKNQNVIYQLTLGSSYLICWNVDRNCWDIKKM
ncbi:hypothetical protein RQM65_15685 [Pricia sp. S334]|uniref:Uncharacterized protein n=1 Tax=Pricia mediterranea TaxID=3076079 RepID=A0ABU3LA84_9FLAO|nr:hypothetical protein [Pricia sp. S334]MDT7830109.1 hypothetical protein [Pricia sp. S334]